MDEERLEDIEDRIFQLESKLETDRAMFGFKLMGYVFAVIVGLEIYKWVSEFFTSL